MFQKVLVLILVLVTPSLSDAASPVQIQMNPLHGFWNFVLAVADFPHSSEIIRDQFEKSPENTEENRKLIANLREILSRYDSTSYSMPDFPQRRDEMSWDLPAFLNLQSGKAKSLDQLSDRIMTLMAPADHTALFFDLKKLEPIYDRLIWKPFLPKLKSQKAKLEAVMKKSNWPDLLDRTKNFYGADWPSSLAFDVAIYPIPAAHGHTNATVIGNLASVEVLTDEKDIEGRLGVVFHEICHALYAAQPLVNQKGLDQHLNNTPGLAAFYTYDLLDEGLATAIGNGWVTLKMTGNIDPKPWYDKLQINTFSKAIYPIVATRLAQKSRIDTTFLDQIIAEFHNAFPDASTDLNLRMSHLILVVDGAPLASDRVRLAFRKRFRMPDTNSFVSADGPEVSATIRSHNQKTTVLLIFSRERRKAIQKLKSDIPEIEPALRAVPDTGGAVVQPTKDQRLVVLVQVEALDQVDRLADQLRKQGNFKDSLLKAM